MSILIVLLLALIVVLTFSLWLVSYWFIKRDQDYVALEKGMDEQQEGFDAICLDYEDALVALNKTLESRSHDLIILQRVAEHHADNCIPDYAPVLGSEEYETMNFYCSDVHKYSAMIEKLKAKEDDPDHVRTAY